MSLTPEKLIRAVREALRNVRKEETMTPADEALRLAQDTLAEGRLDLELNVVEAHNDPIKRRSHRAELAIATIDALLAEKERLQAQEAETSAFCLALQERIKEHEQFRHQHRDCDAMGVELQRLRTELEQVVDALRAVREWRNGSEGPTVLFDKGAEMLRKVTTALAAAEKGSR